MNAVVMVIYLALCVLQSFAIFAGLMRWGGLHWLVALLAAPVAGFTPVAGTAAAFAGAVYGWGLSYADAAIVTVGPFVFVTLVYLAVRTARRPL